MNKAQKKPDLETPERAADTLPKKPRRESEQNVFEHRDEWANSPGLQPPK
jgi:hypothetical protein